MSENNHRRLVAGLVAAVVLSTSLPVLAEPTFSTTMIRVTSRDVDLSTPAGVQRLRNRVDAAIRSACAPVEFGGPIDFGTRDGARALDECSVSARSAAEPQFRRLVAAGNPRMASN